MSTTASVTELPKFQKPLVKVTWVDAADPDLTQSWLSDKDVDDFSADDVVVVSLGWVKSETKRYLTLVADYIYNDDDTFTWGRVTKIPHGMIVKIENLEIKT